LGTTDGGPLHWVMTEPPGGRSRFHALLVSNVVVQAAIFVLGT
jgi:hypothetical protein